MNKTMHFYLRTDKRCPVGVVALCKDDDKLRIAISLCHPNDQWNAERGVAAARARLASERPGRSDTVGLERMRNSGHKPLLLNVALSLKPHGTAAKDQSVGIDWKLAQEIFERQIDYLLNPKPAPETSA